MLPFITYDSNLNIEKLAKQVLKNEPKILKKYPNKSFNLKHDFDGGTGLGPNSLTSRSCHFNVLDWWGTGKLKKKIKEGYEVITQIKDSTIYVQCWANVMRKGEQIKPHSHCPPESYNKTVTGHLNVQVDGSTCTYYNGNPILNKNGEITLFQSTIVHWTDIYQGSSERITLAFDIYNKEQFEYDVYEETKKHWIKI